MSEDLGNRLLTEIDTKFERAVRPELDALLSAVLKLQIRASLDVARADCIPSLEERMPQMIEKAAPIIANPLSSNLKVSIEKRKSGQVQILIVSKPPKTEVLVNTVQTQVERVIPLPPQPSSYETKPGYSLEDTVKEITKETDGATAAGPPKAYPTGMRRTTRTVEESVLNEEKIHLPINYGSGAHFRYNGD